VSDTLARRDPGSAAAAILERVIVGGDLAPLQPAERVTYYRDVCRSLGLNPLTKPFEYLHLNGRLILYARKDCTDQLRARDAVSILELTPQAIGELYVVTAKAVNGTGRTDMATGAVNVKSLAGEALANAMMKAETKAKRRVTLSLCGLGLLDESEVADTPGAEAADVDPTTGEVRDTPPTCDDSPGDDRLITEPQQKRLYAIARGSGWTEEQVHELLSQRGILSGSAKDLPVRDYDAIVDTIKAGPKR
jgi:hypothetical protein